MAAPLWGRWARPLSFRAQVHVNRQRTRESFETAVSIFRRRRCPRFCLSLYSLSLSLSIYQSLFLYITTAFVCMFCESLSFVLLHTCHFYNMWSSLSDRVLKNQSIYIYIYISRVCFILSLSLSFSLSLSCRISTFQNLAPLLFCSQV